MWYTGFYVKGWDSKWQVTTFYKRIFLYNLVWMTNDWERWRSTNVPHIVKIPTLGENSELLNDYFSHMNIYMNAYVLRGDTTLP